MSTRRSPNLKERAVSADNIATSPAASTSNGQNGQHKIDIESSPSRNGTHKAKKRSCLENGRLCLLRNKGRNCWLGLFLAGCIFITTHAALQKMLEDSDILPSSGTQRLRMTYDDDTNNPNVDGSNQRKDRILSHPILDRMSDQWKVLTGPKLFQRANYQAKPLMMGVILVPTKDAMTNYNLDRRRSSQLQALEIPPPDARNGAEDFQIVRINPQDHGKVKYLNTSPKPKLEVEWTFENTLVEELGTGVEKQRYIRKSSNDYDRFKPDSPPKNCEPQYDWQTKSFPNCNDLHQIDVLTRLRTLNPAEEPESVLLARGGYRDVWFVEQNDLPPEELGETIAMKTLLYEHPWNERNMDRHRRDALATDRLRKSKNALDIFGYCGNTGLYEFADGGSLEDAVDNEREWKKWTSKTKMKYAYQVAQAIADTHNVDKEGVPSMSHTDISMSQFVSSDNGKIYRINDFNRARFLFKEKDNPDKLCKFEVSSNKGKFRSPEEYAYKPESAAIDTYSMGNIFFVLLTGDYPFPEYSKKEVREIVKKGQRPEIPSKYVNSEDPLVQALLEAMRRCWVQNPEKRATSREIEQMLRPLALGLGKDEDGDER